MMRIFTLAALASIGLSACTLTKQQQTVDATAAFNVAAAAEAAYAGQPGADPKKVAEAARLLAAAQAALLTWSNSSSPDDETALSAAVAALVAYEAGLPQVAPPGLASAAH
jgi:Skp family chaperone for outer membrane proteins